MKELFEELESFIYEESFEEERSILDSFLSDPSDNRLIWVENLLEKIEKLKKKYLTNE